VFVTVPVPVALHAVPTLPLHDPVPGTHATHPKPAAHTCGAVHWVVVTWPLTQSCSVLPWHVIPVVHPPASWPPSDPLLLDASPPSKPLLEPEEDPPLPLPLLLAVASSPLPPPSPTSKPGVLFAPPQPAAIATTLQRAHAKPRKVFTPAAWQWALPNQRKMVPTAEPRRSGGGPDYGSS